MVLYIRYIWLYSILVLSGDVEENLDPKPKSCRSFSIEASKSKLLRQWDVNNVSVYNFSKVFLLSTYISIHKFDVICISRTFLYSDTAFDGDNLKGVILYDLTNFLTLDKV